MILEVCIGYPEPKVIDLRIIVVTQVAQQGPQLVSNAFSSILLFNSVTDKKW